MDSSSISEPILSQESLQGVWQSLSNTELRLLDWIAYLSEIQSKKSPTGAKWCRPSRKYLADKLGVCVRTISRAASRLQALGLLFVQQRNPIKGIWQTNYYKIIGPKGWALAKFRHRVRSVVNRGTFKSHLSTPERVNNRSEPAKSLPESVGAILQRWKDRGKGTETGS